MANPVGSVEAVFKASETAESRTPEVLAPVLEALKDLKEGGIDSSLVEAAKICADASREEDWRTPLGESGIVAFFQDVLSDPLENTQLESHCLRLIGNSCADNDENRQRVISHPDSLKSVINSMKNPDLATVATVVLYNICLDHEPSQLKAVSDGACSLILEIIGREGFLEDEDLDLDYFGRILEILLSHDAGKSACPSSSLNTLITLASSPHCTFDDHLALFTIFSTLLSSSTFQATLIALDLVPATLSLLESSYNLTPDPASEKQDEKLIAYARNALVENIGDISSQDTFLTTYPLSSALLTQVRSWLHETDEAKVELVVTACLILGNVGRSDEVCRALVGDYGVHKELFDIILHTVRKYKSAVEEARRKKEEEEAGEKKEGSGKGAVAVGVLHAATGVLKNFAIAKGNKEVLGMDGALYVVRDMLSMDGVGVGQVWYSAVGLGRLVCVNCLGNVKFLLQASSITARTLLSEFMRIYAAAEELPTKTEIARTIAAVLRVLNSGPVTSSKLPPYPDLEATLYSHAIARPLWDMVLQDKWPVVRSEGLFALALMARGAAEQLWRECGEAEEKVLVGLGGKDLDNAVVMVAEVKKRLGEEVEGRVEDLLAGLVERREEGKKVVEVRG